MRNLIFYIVSMFLLFSCQEQEESDNQKEWTNKESIFVNQQFSKEEEIDIKLFLKRRPDWMMKETGSGLRYWIYKDKKGDIAKDGDIVDVRFEVKMLDDSLIYKTEENEVSSFKVDKSNVETGVQEGIKYLSEGDKAKFIIPSHLGHGLLGDFEKIPPLQVLVIDIELLKIH